MKKSTANHMHRKRRKNNLTWLFALLGILVLFLGTILAFLIFSNPHHLGKAGEEARPPRTEKNIFQVVRAGSSRRFLPN